MNISVVISAFNEENKIEDCLRSVMSLAKEIILIDNSSQDGTKDIAKKYTQKVYVRPNDPVNLNKNKNYGFSKANYQWILSLDADERITPQLEKEIKQVVKNKGINGYDIPRKNIIFGKWIKNSIWWPDYNLRLFRKTSGKFPAHHVHEKVKVIGDVEKLKNPIIHYNYQTVSQFLRKMDENYTESETENFIKNEKNIYWYDSIRWPANDFLKTFFAQHGYKDGIHGLVLSLFQAFYALVFFAKVWERKEKFRDITPDNFLTSVIKEFTKVIKDSKYWIDTTLIVEKPAKKIFYKIRRKLF